MLAVYTLLEDHLGVRWFWPGAFGEHVPENAGALVPGLMERRTPGFEIRSVELGYSSIYHTKEFNDAARRWARRSRLGWVKSAVFGHSWEAAFDLRKGETFYTWQRGIPPLRQGIATYLTNTYGVQVDPVIHAEVLQRAEALDIPQATVMSRLFHARRRLRERLGDTLDEVSPSSPHSQTVD